MLNEQLARQRVNDHTRRAQRRAQDRQLLASRPPGSHRWRMRWRRPRARDAGLAPTATLSVTPGH
jgi:hypothetical protein